MFISGEAILLLRKIGVFEFFPIKKSCRDVVKPNRKHRNLSFLKHTNISLLNKEIDHLYANGHNRDQDLIKLQCIKEEMIFAIWHIKNGKSYFKAHKTSQLKPENNSLLLTGRKVLYDDFDEVIYKISPMGIEIDLNTLLMKSLQSSGKPVTNKYYQKQWELIENFWPEIFN